MSRDTNPIRIDRLYLRGVGPFEELDLTFREKRHADRADLHVLVGPNGCGKSTVLYALAAVFASSEDDARPFLARLRGPGSFALVPYGEKLSESIRVHSPLLSTTREERVTLAPDAPASVLLGKASFRSFGMPAAFHLKRAGVDVSAAGNVRPARVTAAAFAYAGQRGLGRYHLDAIREPSRGPFDEALSFTATADSETLVQWLATSHTREALAHQAGDDAAAARFRGARRQVEEAVREVIGEDLRFVMSYDPLGISVQRAGVTLDLDVLPDGVKSVVSWVADLLSRLDRMSWEGDVPLLERPFLLLLDEIDIHLHPAWQRKVLPMVQRLFKNAQIIVSTHSPFVVASVSDAWVYPFSVRDGTATLGEVIPSQAGASVSSVLRSVFGVPEEFDVETEASLARFYAARDAVLAGDSARFSEFTRLAQDAAARGEEVEDIVASEVAQVTNRLGAAP